MFVESEKSNKFIILRSFSMNEAIVYRTRNFQADFVLFMFDLLTMSMVLMVTKLLLQFIPEILDHQHQKLLVHEEI